MMEYERVMSSLGEVDGRTAFQFVMAAMMGIGLAAACGFRVFAPLLLFGLGHRLGWVDVHPEYAWLSTDLSLVVLGVAVVAETASLYVPWVDTALTSAASPLAVLAGSFAALAATGPQEGIFEWVVPIVTGGMTAGLVHGMTVVVKSASTAVTGGFANPIISTIELIAAVAAAVLAILAPIVMFLIFVGLALWWWRLLARGQARRRSGLATANSAPTV
jgi:hypothetical protein